MGIHNIQDLFGDGSGPRKRDKSKNTPEFNKKAKERRGKSKKKAEGRKTNRK